VVFEAEGTRGSVGGGAERRLSRYRALRLFLAQRWLNGVRSRAPAECDFSAFWSSW